MEGQSQFIKVISKGDREFYLDERIAMLCNKFKELLKSKMMEQKKTEFYELIFENIDGKIMEIIIEYLHYKARYLNSPIDQIPKFKIEPPELGLEVLKAAIDLKL